VVLPDSSWVTRSSPGSVVTVVSTSDDMVTFTTELGAPRNTMPRQDFQQLHLPRLPPDGPPVRGRPFPAPGEEWTHQGSLYRILEVVGVTRREVRFRLIYQDRSLPNPLPVEILPLTQFLADERWALRITRSVYDHLLDD
jgi:hypothetical protein